MDKKSKQISGLSDAYFVRKQRNFFSDEEKVQIVEDFLNSGSTKRDIWEKYTGHREEHGTILRWMREFGYINNKPVKRYNFESNHFPLKKKAHNLDSSDDFENLQLKKRIEELEKQLKDTEMKAIAYSTMVDIAEKEFNIPIRKKSNTKPLKK